MFKRDRKLHILFLVMVLFFIYGLIQIFLIRFETGDVYPAYSSLRSDPLGTQALFESLNYLADKTARRNFRPLDQIAWGADRTVVLCGLPEKINPQMRSHLWKKMMENLSKEGGRLILAFKATATGRYVNEDNDQEESEKELTSRDDTAEEEDSVECNTEHDEKTAWSGLTALGIDVERTIGRGNDLHARTVSSDPSILLPVKIPWHGALFFTMTDETWQVIYERDEQPVVVERSWGRGTVVMIASSYLFSNEALRKDRFVDLLTWAFIPQHEVIFDESHFGLSKQPSIAGLALKYRLHGVIASIAVIAILLVWQYTAVFIPAPGSTSENGMGVRAAVGRDTTEGLVYLMQHHIASKDVLTVSFNVWKKSSAVQVSEEKMRSVEKVINDYRRSEGSQNPVAVYRYVCQLLKQGKIL